MFLWENKLMIPLRAVVAFIRYKMFDNSDYSKLPDSGFISRYQKTEDKRIPFVSHWTALPSADVRAGIENSNRRFFLKPVTLDYFQNMPEDERARREIEKLRDYFDTRLKKSFREAENKTRIPLLADEPGPDVLTLEFALLCAKPAFRIKNIILRSLSWMSTVVGLVLETLLWRQDDMGYAAMGIRVFYEGELVGEIADFEYGLESVTGLMLFDIKSARAYAYQQASIDRWSESLATLCSTTPDVPVKRTLFTWKPY